MEVVVAMSGSGPSAVSGSLEHAVAMMTRTNIAERKCVFMFPSLSPAYRAARSIGGDACPGLPTYRCCLESTIAASVAGHTEKRGEFVIESLSLRKCLEHLSLLSMSSNPLALVLTKVAL